MNALSRRMDLLLASALLGTALQIGVAADQPGIRASLESAKDRKPAPNFILEDAAGKTVQLKDYRGKVLLLDFWVTWCAGCKKEIPWFAEFHTRYGSKRLAVVGASLDDAG